MIKFKIIQITKILLVLLVYIGFLLTKLDLELFIKYAMSETPSGEIYSWLIRGFLRQTNYMFFVPFIMWNIYILFSIFVWWYERKKSRVG